MSIYMKVLKHKAARVMDILTANLDKPGDARKIDTTDGCFMPVSVHYLNDSPQGRYYSITHYYEQNGDLMSDPDVVFIKRMRKQGDDFTFIYMPISYRQDGLGICREYVTYDDDMSKGMRIIGVDHKQQEDLTDFCNTWMKNISQQQDLTQVHLTEKETA